MSDLISSDLSAVQESLRSGKLTCRELVTSYLNNIEAQKDLNVFIEVFADEALQKADETDALLKSGNAGKLAGAVISVKDVIAIKDKGLTCSSAILKGFKSLYDSTAVARLRSEGAIIIGRVNCDEFAMGSSNENSVYGPVANPFDKTRVPGGSSGASAVSVAAGMCIASLGSETGGSIRQPASFCGVTGLKVTYGRISRYGLVAFASSFDTIGIFSKSNDTTSRVLEVIAGHDPNDSTSSAEHVPAYSESVSARLDPSKIRLGYIKEYFGEGLDGEVRDGVFGKIEALKQNGFSVREISLPNSKYLIQTYYVLTCAEASSNLSRYDGVRYGFRAEDHDSLEEMYVNTRSRGFGTEVKRRIMLGTYVLSAGYYDAYYRKAQKARRLIREDFENAFRDVDYIITPTTPTTAFRIGEKIDDPLSMYLSDIYTVSANLAGIPAMSVPAGTDSKGLPFGIQIIGKKFDEGGLLRMWNEI
ncbi:MAG: Asp-tRNA(Asn)/Glu-tRNA(Gln) amidotransferase subunit GatA [Ignavibacteria bacterium]|nr:Asp-tRNA(Asn)/Glu-tRNA(Gln) amidotransferase subunit GatA [Ignavibacteria bacterium]